MSHREYVYRVVGVERVTDGDTYWLRLDVGFRQCQLTHIRLLGYDCPERYSGTEHERAEAKRATEFVIDWFRSAPIIGVTLVRTERDPDSFGRWLGEVWLEGSEHTWLLGDDLVANGLAVKWPMRWREAERG